ncbi:MAG: hypothetical protein ACRELG_01125 [Gemmataceae bacterium]
MSTETEPGKAVQPSKRRVRIEEVDGDLELSYRQCGFPGGCFLLLWLSGWTVGCTVLIRQVLIVPTFFNILVAVPFLTSWVFVFALLVWMFFGVECVRLGFEGLEYRAEALVTWGRRTVSRAEMKGVSADVTTYQVNDRNLPYLRFETLGQPLGFARGISEEEQRWLVQWLNEYLDTLGLHGQSAAPIGILNTSRGEVLQAPAMPLEPPSDSRIDVHYHANALAFVWQGAWSLAAFASMTFLNLFWNGIVGVFVCQLIQEFHWLLFFFLIPFEVVGLVMCAMWLVALTAPLWSLKWTFGEREVTRRLCVSDTDEIVFSFGWSKRFDIHSPVRIALRRPEEKKPSGSLWPLLSHPDGEYTLYFLDQADKELLAINYLTEGDARWIADVLLCAFPSWSRNERRVPSDRNSS